MSGTFLMLGVMLMGFITSLFAWCVIGYPLWHDYLVPVFQVLGGQ